METIQFKAWELLVDKETTKLTYQNIDGGIAEGCLCNACRNFITNRELIFTEEVRMLFSELGIDYHKECENMHYNKLKNGMHSYHFWFHFKGKIMDQKSDSSAINDHLWISFGDIQYPTFFEDVENLAQVEFHAEIPWTIEKELETE